MKSFSLNSSKSLTRQDYYQIITSVLMTILGGIILIRALFSGIFILTLLVGGGFLGLGTYRLSFIYRFLKGRKK
jgi:MFS superfamily sulfate permease-like transporter